MNQKLTGEATQRRLSGVERARQRRAAEAAQISSGRGSFAQSHEGGHEYRMPAEIAQNSLPSCACTVPWASAAFPDSNDSIDSDSGSSVSLRVIVPPGCV